MEALREFPNYGRNSNLATSGATRHAQDIHGRHPTVYEVLGYLRKFNQ